MNATLRPLIGAIFTTIAAITATITNRTVMLDPQDGRRLGGRASGGDGGLCGNRPQYL